MWAGQGKMGVVIALPTMVVVLTIPPLFSFPTMLCFRGVALFWWVMGRLLCCFCIKNADLLLSLLDFSLSSSLILVVVL